MDPEFNENMDNKINGSDHGYNFTSEGSGDQGSGLGSENDIFNNIFDILNQIGEEDLVPKEWSTLAKVTLAFLYIFIIIMALLGNIMVVFVIMGNQNMQTVTNRFLLSLATSDICLAVFNMPLSLVFYIKHEWIVGEFLCKFANFMQGVFIVASIFTLTAIAIDRYYAILYPLRVRHIHTRTRAIIVIATIWIISILLVSPQVAIQRLGMRLSINLESNELSIVKLCEEYFAKRSTQIAYTLFTYIFVYILPVIIMAFTYGAIAEHLWRRQPIGELPSSSHDHERHIVETKSILRMIITIVLFFILAWMPFFSCQLFFLFHRRTNLSFEITAILQLIGYSNTCVNPVVYCFLNEKFRRCARSLLHSLGPVKALCGSRQLRRLSSISTKVVMASDTSNGK